MLISLLWYWVIKSEKEPADVFHIQATVHFLGQVQSLLDPFPIFQVILEESLTKCFMSA